MRLPGPRPTPPDRWSPEPDRARFPLRHFWPLGLVVAMGLAAGAVVLAERLRPEPEVEVALPASALAGGVSRLEAVSVLVVTEPRGAWISVDGAARGTTPLLVEEVALGERRLTLSREGYETLDTLVDVTPGLSLRFELRPAPMAEAVPAPPATVPPPVAVTEPPPAPVPAGPGRLRVVVRPWGTIAVDGEVRRRETDVAYEAEASAGTHRVQVSHPALGTREQTVTVRPGETTTLTVDLNDR